MPSTYHTTTDSYGRRYYYSSTGDSTAHAHVWNEPVGMAEWTPAKKNVHPKCRLCTKFMRGKKYVSEGRWGAIKICSNCKFIYDTLHREIFDNKNIEAIKKIYNTVSRDYIKTHRYNIKWIKGTTTTKFIRCKFCNKKLTNGYMYINMSDGSYIFSCRNCEYLFQLMTKEWRRSNGYAINEIFKLLEYIYRYYKV